MIRRRLRKLATFARLPASEQALAMLALVLIGAASAMIALLPFRFYARLLGRQHGAVGYAPLLDKPATRRAVLARRAIGRAAGVAPFRSNCLPQSIVAALLARMLGFPLSTHLGVRVEGAAMKAHAWSVAGPIMVSGGFSFGHYAIVSCFVTEAT